MQKDSSVTKPKEENKKLEVFGRLIFKNNVSTFSPVDDAVPKENYRLGPGDEILIYISGSQEAKSSSMVTRDGDINLPLIGPINVSGITFKQLQDLVSANIKSICWFKSSISLGRLRAINVFITGEVSTGLYSVSALTSITNALLTSGGPNDIGSLRNIIVRRDGRIISKLDMYEVLMEGVAKNDIILETGDVIFIPPYENFVEMTGEVKRPGIYELKKGETLHDAIKFSED